MISAARFSIVRIPCYWRPVIMGGAAVVLLGVFWFASRYPQLFSKAEHLGQALPSMAFSSRLLTVAADAPTWLRIAAATVNWLDSMKIGMTFGVLFGALLHTVSLLSSHGWARMSSSCGPADRRCRSPPRRPARFERYRCPSPLHNS
jgi:hypothetical protein